jgi:hypothetical protein
VKEQAILMDLNSVPGSDSDTSIPKIDDDRYVASFNFSLKIAGSTQLCSL